MNAALKKKGFDMIFISKRIGALCLAAVLALTLCITLTAPIEVSAAKSPYSPISSGDYTKGQGVGSESYSSAFKGLKDADNGDWAGYTGYNFASGAKKLVIRYMKGTASNEATVCCKVRVDSPAGKIIASVNLSGRTGASWVTKEVACNENGQVLLGTHDIYLTFVVAKGAKAKANDVSPQLSVGKFYFTKKSGGIVDKSMSTTAVTSTAFRYWIQYDQPVHLIKWKPISKVTGYEMAVSTNARFTANVYKKQLDNTQCNLYLKQGAVWYVRVRTFKKSGNLTVYSNWSPVVRVTAKKGHAVKKTK